MNVVLAVAAGGALGSVARYFMAAQVNHWMGPGFPYGTLVVNALGGLVMGILIETMALRWSPTPELRAFLTVGILGGFTTFSAFSLDVVLLVERGEWLKALAYVASSVVLSVGALFAGMRALRAVMA